MGTIKAGAMNDRVEDDSGTGDIGARVEGLKVSPGAPAPAAEPPTPALPDPAAVRAARKDHGGKKGRRR